MNATPQTDTSLRRLTTGPVHRLSGPGGRLHLRPIPPHGAAPVILANAAKILALGLAWYLWFNVLVGLLFCLMVEGAVRYVFRLR